MLSLKYGGCSHGDRPAIQDQKTASVMEDIVSLLMCVWTRYTNTQNINGERSVCVCVYVCVCVCVGACLNLKALSGFRSNEV